MEGEAAVEVCRSVAAAVVAAVLALAAGSGAPLPGFRPWPPTQQFCHQPWPPAQQFCATSRHSQCRPARHPGGLLSLNSTNWPVAVAAPSGGLTKPATLADFGHPRLARRLSLNSQPNPTDWPTTASVAADWPASPLATTRMMPPWTQSSLTYVSESRRSVEPQNENRAGSCKPSNKEGR